MKTTSQSKLFRSTNMFFKIPVNKKCPISALVDCSQPATTANFEYSGSLAWYLASVAQLDAPSDWRPGGRGFNPRRGRQHFFMEIDHEIFSTVILSLPLIQEGQLSDSGERMCTILVNYLEDYACPVNVWLDKLTALDMSLFGWLGRKPQHKQTISIRSKKWKVTFWQNLVKLLLP